MQGERFNTGSKDDYYVAPYRQLNLSCVSLNSNDTNTSSHHWTKPPTSNHNYVTLYTLLAHQDVNTSVVFGPQVGRHRMWVIIMPSNFAISLHC